MSFTPADLKVACKSVEPLRAANRSTGVNLDGIVISTSGKRTPMTEEYVQIFRSGIIEVVCGNTIYTYNDDPKNPKLFYTYNEHNLATKLPVYLEALKTLGVPTPIYLFLTIQGAKGVSIQRKGSHDLQTPFDRDILALPNTQIDDFAAKSLEVLMPLFDMIWNAAGYEKCYSFDASGKWVNSH
jgi:hypothetical protein